MKTFMALTLIGASTTFIFSDALADQYLFDIASKEPYKKAYEAMFTFPEWVRSGQGTSSPVQNVVLGGQTYTLGQMCKPHDCADNQFIVVFSPDKTKAWGLLATRSSDDRVFNTQMLGEPDNAVRDLLNKTLADNNPED
ncbi:Ivy family c-type lysozyme inhibitor [Pseudomonas sp. NPDC096917]|uniref:Ivy family c-type lysozyme inhibitor n=1 Tax=Pseudomonas sp. NPDC096917 TaxID=3364483 RepID=UPI00383BA2C9